MKQKIGKAHSKRHALAFVQLGWTVQTEFGASRNDEPYEYLFCVLNACQRVAYGVEEGHRIALADILSFAR
jgi:hypothetical protein